MTDFQMIHLIIRRFEQDTGVRMLIEWAKNKRQNFASDETTPRRDTTVPQQSENQVENCNLVDEKGSN